MTLRDAADPGSSGGVQHRNLKGGTTAPTLLAMRLVCHRHRLVSVILGSLALTSQAAPPTTRPAFTVLDDNWHDAARDRTLPVRLYLPADVSKPAATIVVSHGLGDSRAAMAYACREWASRGFVVVALQHPGSDDSVWKDLKPTDRFSAILKAASAEQFGARCRDVSFALDQLQRLTAAPGPLAGRIDTARFGIAGHSFGALTAQAIIGERYAVKDGLPPTFKDDRVKAAVIMSPGIEGATDLTTAFAEVTVPAFHFTGTNDVVAGLGITTPSKRRVPYDRMTKSDQYLVTFDRGDHIVFSGHRMAQSDVKRDEAIEAATATLSADFFEAYLGKNEEALTAIDRDAAALGAAAKFDKKSAVTPPANTPVAAP